jgi:methylated-DNA-[protein]-cysteine S-methyltransferase
MVRIMVNYTSNIDSPIGIVEINSTNEEIISIKFKDSVEKSSLNPPEVLKRCIEQLEEYFLGKRKNFNIPILFDGTAFQKQVWQKLLEIPYGKTVSYQFIAESVGDRNATRAVGNANGQNPISIIIPCHRVIGRNGKLTGYGGGLHRKKWLLDHERGLLNLDQFV